MAEEENFRSLARINRELISKAESLDSAQRVVLDMDSTEVPVYGQQEQQAASWKTARRVVAKVEHHAGELFPRVGFIVTNLTLPSRAVVRFYNKRGASEQWIKEGKQAVNMTRLSCHRYRSNEVRLWLSVIAYNLGNLWRRLMLPQRIGKW